MVKKTERIGLWLSVVVLLCICGPISAQDARQAQWLDTWAKAVERANSTFIQIPGPNPVLVRGPKGSWDSYKIEAGDIFKDHDTYYLYYHGQGSGRGWKVGVATANHPLGPWKKYEKNPIQSFGPCPFVLKEKTNKFYMWFTGDSYKGGGVGLATASSPLGPWKEYEKNPVMKNFGYIGGVVKYQSKYYLYTAYPVGSTGSDYSPMALAIADRPEGPYKEYEGNPILGQTPWGSWDDGGYSEGEVYLQDGIFHMFYGGAKLQPNRMQTRESIGYAYSFDGIHFTRHPRNPVAIREIVPDAGALAEVHAYAEGPFIYLFHTLRYNNGEEDLGVQVLATQKPFKLRMPILIDDPIEPRQTTSLKKCVPLCLDSITTLTLTGESTYGPQSSRPVRLHIKTSYDGFKYDTVDMLSLELSFAPGKTVRQTFEVKPNVKYIKVQMENLDKSAAVSDVSVYATVGG